ncbi:MAG TPA: flavoprotein [Phycisphaerae bacterium]|nr:flavoprotein [Phycisphaerae bacterium]
MSAEPRQLDGYEVLLCPTGGIACYKSADLTSRLVQAGAGVTVAMTESATRFVGPLTFQTLTAREVYTSMWQSLGSYDVKHLSLTERADLMIVAPATANILAKMAGGIADDLVSALALSAHGACPVLLAPAMNTRMWEAPPTRANLQRLTDWGAHVVGPGSGRLACGDVGPGRMAEPAEVFDAAAALLRAATPKRARPA